jgi:hypothetical protein
MKPPSPEDLIHRTTGCMFLSEYVNLSVALSVETPLYPYGISYCMVLWISLHGLFKKYLGSLD